MLADHGLNMSKLESRPSREGTWEYVFWVDLDADLCADGPGAAVLADLRAVTVWVRVMGCYPRGASPSLTRSLRRPGPPAGSPPIWRRAYCTTGGRSDGRG